MFELRKARYCKEIRSRVTEQQFEILSDAIEVAEECGAIKGPADFVRNALMEYALKFPPSRNGQY